MHLLVLGGNSDLAVAVAHRFAAREGAAVTLASRDMDLLEKRANDLALRYRVPAKAVPFDATDFDSHQAFYDSLDPAPDVVLAAFGNMAEQHEAQKDFHVARRMIDTNFTGAASILEIAAARMEELGRGSIIGVSSVAGERGRRSNYIYGSAKAGFTAYLSGLRNRLAGAGVQVITVLPGFVRTKMTEGMDLPERLVAEPEQAARDIHRAWKRGRDVVYTKWIWRWIMLVIRNIPERIFKKTNI